MAIRACNNSTSRPRARRAAPVAGEHFDQIGLFFSCRNGRAFLFCPAATESHAFDVAFDVASFDVAS